MLRQDLQVLVLRAPDGAAAFLAALGQGTSVADPSDPCAGCLQSCAAQCATKVRSLMEIAADRIE